MTDFILRGRGIKVAYSLKDKYFKNWTIHLMTNEKKNHIYLIGSRILNCKLIKNCKFILLERYCDAD